MTEQLTNRPVHAAPEPFNPIPGEDSEDGPSYRTSRYTVYPSGYSRVGVPQRRHWRVFVEDSGDGWSVRWRNRCLNISSTWEFEPPPKGRTPEFLNRCRFSERGALMRAKQAVDRLVVDGMTYEAFVEHVNQEAAAAAESFLQEHRTGAVAGKDGLATPLWDRFLHAFRYKTQLD